MDVGWRLCAALIAALWFVHATPAVAVDASPLVLEHLTTADGLPQATVMTTLQDSQGFVWLGTEDGLVRYDGRVLFRYAHSRTDPRSLAGNFIWQVLEDGRHDLWIAIKDGGLARWNRSSDTFTSYTHDPRDPASLGSNSVRTILVDRAGRIWVGTTNAGIDVLDPASGQIEHLRRDPGNPASLLSDRISALTLDRAGILWIGTDKGLQRSTSSHADPDHLTMQTIDSIKGRQVSRIFEDQRGALWIGTFDSGLIQIDAGGRVLARYRHESHNEASLSSDDIRALLEDQAGHLWAGTASGLDLLDRARGMVMRYRSDPRDADSLRDSFIMSLYQDDSGLVWIGTRNGGVSRWSPRSWELGGYRPAWLAGKTVMAFAPTSGDDIWIGTLDGIARFNSVTGAVDNSSATSGEARALERTHVTALQADRSGALWIGTMTDGLKKLSPTGRLQSIAVKPGSPHALSAAGIMTIYESRAGQIWLGTFGGGVNVLDPTTGRIKQLPYAAETPGAVSAGAVTTIAEDQDGFFWIGTDGGGLNLANSDGTVLSVFKHHPEDPASLPANTVYSIAMDGARRIWIGTDGGGLARVEGSARTPQSIRFHTLSRTEGLSSDTIYGVVPDNRGNLWLSGNAGLMRLDPRSGVVKTYHREHGLQGEEFGFGAYARLPDGRICFGGAGGFNLFQPTHLYESPQPPRVVLTGVQVQGVPTKGATPYWLEHRVALDYRDNIVSLDFGVLDFTSSRHNRLAYRMSGITEEWLEVGPDRRVMLTNVDSGDHVLEVRAATADSVWNQTPLRLAIHRDSPPWRSLPAYLSYALLVVAVVWNRVRWHKRRFAALEQARVTLESQVQVRTRELVESNRQLNEALEAKSSFLDRMSHELRTPMNGVVGMTELLCRTPLSQTQVQLARTIRSSADTLLGIVNDLLDLSKIRAGKLSLERLPLDLVQLLEECTSMFAGAAQEKGIELIACPPPVAHRMLLGDPLRLRQVLMNLVGNAVKFTQHGEVVARADVNEEEDGTATLLLTVSDTGIGMDAKSMGRIFEPFTQADETTTRRFGGTGLGLSICRELADLMGGQITVKSQPQMGSTFCLTVPLPTEALSGPAARETGVNSGVCLLTRSSSLSTALERYLSLLGLTSVSDERAKERAFAHTGPVVLDVSSHLELLKDWAADCRVPSALVILASVADVEAHGLRSLAPQAEILLKPVRRLALFEAFSRVLKEHHTMVQRCISDAANTSFAGRHVLLVEDEPVNAAVAEGYLVALGCTTVWAKDGTTALGRSSAERFDLVLMDLNMPDMDGYSTAALLRKRESEQSAEAISPRVPIVALTAHDPRQAREKCLAAGMDDVLGKPFTFAECEDLLTRWLVGRRESEPQTTPKIASLGEYDLSSIDPVALGRLRDMRAGQAVSLFEKLTELFASSSSATLTGLHKALASEDLPAAAALCHKLKSSAANVGASNFGRHVKQLEERCLQGDIARARELFSALSEAHPLLLQALKTVNLRASA